MGSIRRAAHEKNTVIENTEYYRNSKCRRTLDFTGHFKTFSVTGYPKWKKLFNSGFMGQKIQKSKNGLQVQNLIFVFLYCEKLIKWSV
jgi:hypothetical protein